MVKTFAMTPALRGGLSRKTTRREVALSGVYRPAPRISALIFALQGECKVIYPWGETTFVLLVVLSLNTVSAILSLILISEYLARR